jgi:NRPS condensation-like uncharacterized protein
VLIFDYSKKHNVTIYVKFDYKRGKMKNKEVKKSKQKKAKVNEPNRELAWYKLDNAALIYPAVGTKKWNAVYRVSAVLKQVVKPEILNKALQEVIKRFPHLNVSLNRGFFWFYFQEINTLPEVELDENYPCRKMDFRPNKHLFRVLYFNKKVSFEAFHSLTDGYGATIFLNTLLSRYFELLGENINKENYIINYLDKPTSGELEDSFARYADLKSRNKWSENKAYQIVGTKEEYGKLNIINGIMSAEEIKQFAKSYNATVTQFLFGVLFKSVLNYQKSKGYNKKPVRISLPINLRNIFPSNSLRNFSSYMNVEFTSAEANLELAEIIEKIKLKTSTINKEYVMGNINANVKAQKNLLLRITPLFIKNIVLKLVFYMVGEQIFTMSMSNIGKISAPQEFSDLVERYEVNLGAGKINKMGTTVITFNDVLVFTFSSTIKETRVQEEFFNMLTKMGLKVKIETNLK